MRTSLRTLLIAISLWAWGCDYYEKPNQPMPDLGLVALDGKTFSPESMKGSAWVITAWLPGCGVCAREVPDLEAVRKEYEPLGVRFLAVSIDSDADTTRKAAARAGLTMEIATAQGPVLDRLGLKGVPSTVFLSMEGRIIASASGGRGRGFLERRTHELLGNGPNK